MPRPRFEKLPTEKQTLILEAAAHEFSARGYENASMNRILAEAGISKGAAYYYFEDKADLFMTTVAYAAEIMAGVIDFDPLSLTAETYWPELERLYTAQYRVGLEHPHLFGTVKTASQPGLDTQDHPRLVGFYEEMTDLLRDLLKQGQALNVVRSDLPDDLLFALVKALDNTLDDHILSRLASLSPEAVPGWAAATVDSIRRILTPH